MEPQASLDQILREIDDPDQHILLNPRSVLQSVDSLPSLVEPPTPNHSPGSNASDLYNNNASALPTFSQTFPASQETFSETVKLCIMEQPIERCRFRYRAEQGPHGSLKSASSKKARSCPKVQMTGCVPNAAYIVAKLYTNENPPRLHVNDLWGSNCMNGNSTMPLDGNNISSFANLGIMRQKEKEIGDVLVEKYIAEHMALGYQINDELRDALRERANKEQVTLKDCVHCVRIGFQGFYPDPATGRLMQTQLVLSQPVFNSQNAGFTELRIAEVSRSCGSVLGGDSIWMRCGAKVRRDQIKIRFHEPSTGWEAEGIFAPSEVYEQILVIFKTPAYRDVNINERVHVNIHLLRSSDGEYSPPIDFVYLPAEEGPQAKKRKLVGTFGDFDSYLGPGPSGQQQFAPPSRPQNVASEMNAYMPSGNTNQQHQHRRTENVAPPTGANDFMPVAARPPVPPREEVSLVDLKLSDEAHNKVKSVMAQLWETQVEALRSFSGDGDPKSLVLTCKQLIGWQDEDGDSALHIAVRNRQAFALKTLLTVLSDHPDKEAILNCKNRRKQTPLHLAVRFNDADCAHYLISAGAERTHMDNSGNTVLHYLADTFTEDIYKDLLFPPHDTVAGKQNVDLGLRNNAGHCPLHLAVKRLRLSLIENLLEAGAPVDIQDRNTGYTSLMMAAESNDVEAVQLLMQYKASATVQAMDGSTALHWAVRNNNEPLVATLIEAGANPEEKSAFWNLNDDQMDSETLVGESTDKLSAFDVAGENERLLKLLKKEPLEKLCDPPSFRRPAAKPEEAGAVGGIRPKVRFTQAEEGMPSDILAQGRPNFTSNVSSASSSGAPSPAISRASTSHLLPSVAALKDDLGSLDFVTRLRLSKLLDVQGKWERLAESVGCQHMIEFINVCTDADESSSATMVLLDQYEHMPGASVPRLLNALSAIDQNAVGVIVRSQQLSPHVHSDLEEDGLLTEAAGGFMDHS